jgi:hypothetical protein
MILALARQKAPRQRKGTGFMAKTKHTSFSRVLNRFMAFAAVGALSITVMQTAHAASQDEVPDFYASTCQHPSKKLSKTLQKKCSDVADERHKNWVDKQMNLNTNDPTVLRAFILSMKAQYLKLQNREQTLDKTNTALQRQYSELKKKASQSCSAATLPSSLVKGTSGLGSVPVLGEKDVSAPAAPQIDVLTDVKSAQ